jgi:transposase InsO family protein
MTTAFVLDALNQAICQRSPEKGGGFIHHSDRGSQYLSIKYTERLADAGIDPSVGTVGDSYEFKLARASGSNDLGDHLKAQNALAEGIIGLFKTEVTKLLGPWKSMGQLEWETLKWVDWYNTKRLHSAIHCSATLLAAMRGGYVTPHEAEEMFDATLNPNEKAA